MPKKSDNKQSKPAYPTQAPAPMAQPYPMQPMYQQQPQQAPYNPAMQASAPYGLPPGMPEPPPSYDQAMHHPVAPQNYAPNQWGPGQMQPGAPYAPQAPQAPFPPQAPYAPQVPYGYGPPQHQSAPMMYAPHQPAFQQQPVHVHQVHTPATVVVPGGFDAGARFDSTSQPRIPPPPPGIAPNVAQMAQASGQNVVVGQRPDNFLVGGSSGGAVFW